MTAIYNLLSESFFLKLATSCKNLFLSLVVVRLVIWAHKIILFKISPMKLNFFFFWGKGEGVIQMG